MYGPQAAVQGPKPCGDHKPPCQAFTASIG